MDLSTGIWWVGPRLIIKVPVGYTDARYGNVLLSSTLHADPNAEFFFNKTVSIKTAYTYAYEDYNDAGYDGYDNSLNRITLGPSFYLFDRRHIISPSIAFEHRNADLDRASYSATSAAISYFTRLPMELELVCALPMVEP